MQDTPYLNTPFPLGDGPLAECTVATARHASGDGLCRGADTGSSFIFKIFQIVGGDGPGYEKAMPMR
jgi:hypothetical protein